MVPTHTFRLLSGPECEVKEFGGKHQEILTRGGVGNIEKKLITCLTDLVVRVGSQRSFTEDEILNLFSADRKLILFQARQFSLDFEPEFKFTYKYVDSKGRKQEHEEIVTFDDGQVPQTPFYKQWNELSEIEKIIKLTLPKSGIELQYTMLDGKGEGIGAAVHKNDRSTNTALKMRNPCELVKKENATVPIQSLLHYGLKDMEALRADIKAHEGRVDTEIMFEHPDPDKREDVIIDMTSQLAFFYPSEAL